MANQIQLRRDTAAAWTSANPTLAAGEIGVETDTAKQKMGDGSTAWTSLSYSGINNVADDATPQLGGNLDVNDKKITSASNGDIEITPDGTGSVGIGTASPNSKLHIATTSSVGSPAAWGSGEVTVSPNTGATSAALGLSYDTSADESNISSIAPNVAWKNLNLKASSFDFLIGGSSAAVIDTAGKVGIGTASPGARLDVTLSSTATNGSDPQAQITNTGTSTANQRSEMLFRMADGVYNGNSSMYSLRESATARTQSLVLAPSDSSGTATERMRVNSSGNVGIGTTSPDAKLEIEGTTLNPGLLISATTTGDSGMRIKNSQREFSFDVITGGNFRIYDRTGGANRLTIDTSGNFLPGITETQDLGSASLEWDNLFVANSPTVSDERRKENIVPITGATDFINSLEPVWFTYKDTVIPEVPAELHEAGEELEKAIPAVYETKVVTEAVEAVLDEDGNIVEESIDEVTEQVEITPEVPAVIADGTEVKTEAIPEKIVTHSRPHTGFIAQKVKQAMTDNGMEDWAGYAYHEEEDLHMLRPTETIGMLAAAVKELTARIEELEK